MFAILNPVEILFSPTPQHDIVSHMRMPFRKFDRIGGIEIPRRGFTIWAAAYALPIFAAPVLAAAFILDVALYLRFDRVFGACYGILCLMG